MFASYSCRVSQARRRSVVDVSLGRARAAWFTLLAGSTAYRRLILVQCPIDPPPVLREATIPLQYDFLEPHRIGDLRSLPADTVPRDASARFDRGERCWVGRHEGRIVSMRWLAERRAYIEYLQTWLNIGADTVYGYNSVTHPAYRNHGLFTASLTHLIRVLGAQGYKRKIGAVLPENHASRHALEKAGYRRAGVIGVFGVGPWRHHFIHTTAADGPRPAIVCEGSRLGT